MKAKVIREFVDKYTNELYAVGREITVTKDRYEEIRRVGDFVEEIKDPKKADKAPVKD